MKFYFRMNEKIHGPFSAEQINKIGNSGKIDRNTPLCLDANGKPDQNWLPALAHRFTFQTQPSGNQITPAPTSTVQKASSPETSSSALADVATQSQPDSQQASSPEQMEASADQTESASWYYIDSANQQNGPHSIDVIKQLHSSRVIESQTWVWCEGMDDWIAFENVDDWIAFENVEAFKTNFACPHSWDWETLEPISGGEDEEKVRFCAQCNKNVYWCSSEQQLKKHGMLGNCVAFHRNELEGDCPDDLPPPDIEPNFIGTIVPENETEWHPIKRPSTYWSIFFFATPFFLVICGLIGFLIGILIAKFVS